MYEDLNVPPSGGNETLAIPAAEGGLPSDRDGKVSQQTEKHVPTETISAQSAVLRVVRFASEKDADPKPWEGRALDLVGKHEVRATKKGTKAFSAAIYPTGVARGTDNVVGLTTLVLDFDRLSTAQFEIVANVLTAKRWSFVAYSSFSHLENGPEDHRFRVILFADRKIEAAEYVDVWKSADAHFQELTDRSGHDRAHIWYLPACPPERAEHAWVHSEDGVLFDVDAAVRHGRTLPMRPAAGDDPKETRTRNNTSRQERRDQSGGRRSIRDGGRNNALTSIAGGLRRRGASRDEILAHLRTVNAEQCAPPLEDDELVGIANSIERYEPASPLLTLNWTDSGNAERFCAFAGENFRYVFKWDRWLRYDGKRWAEDENREHMLVARNVLRRTVALAEESGEDELASFARKSENRSGLSAMIELAHPLLAVNVSELDTHKELFNCANGTIDLRTGELRPHDRADFLTHTSTVAYDPDAQCPVWLAFLHRVLDGNSDLISFIQRAVGYSLTGRTDEQCLLMLYGTGANGKSTFLETVRGLLCDYSMQADFSTFHKRDSEGPRNDLARLVGTRFVSAVESDPGKPLAEPLVKQLTGEDTITARFLRQEFFEFKPQFKIWLATNHKPTIVGGDHGIWRRIKLVPFTVTIPEADRDPKLAQKLAAEMPGILAWAVRGCLDWRVNGLGTPPEVAAATAAYREEMDDLGPFLDATTVCYEGARVSAAALYNAYMTWCTHNGETPRNNKRFAMGLRERGFASVKGSQGARCWAGVKLLGERAQDTAND